MKNLENFGVQELSINDTKKIEGGFWNYVGAAVAYFLYETAANPKASSSAFWEGFESTQ